ncbi:co-chaperone GroES [Eubacteriales bacterium OttesenSCG-928-M02]|nr:co-chaperone GroES [Eubacteriales bacterium OttesenSCG-928-M02]
MKIRPIGDMVLLKAKEEETVSSGGIIIPDTAKEKPMFGTAVAVGPGGNVDGKEIEMVVKEGDEVIYRRYAGTDIKFEDQEYILVRQNDIIGIVEA